MLPPSNSNWSFSFCDVGVIIAPSCLSCILQLQHHGKTIRLLYRAQMVFLSLRLSTGPWACQGIHCQHPRSHELTQTEGASYRKPKRTSQQEQRGSPVTKSSAQDTPLSCHPPSPGEVEKDHKCSGVGDLRAAYKRHLLPPHSRHIVQHQDPTQDDT